MLTPSKKPAGGELNEEQKAFNRMLSGVRAIGIPIDPRAQLPAPNNMVKTEVITWVDFKFNNIDVSALWLLKESLKQVVILKSINT